ncbi:MbcA/ParS/Xre antitoxin family protein [Massilia sp. 9096]|uniref:MbcA/ParS/Xre antitoxin family protein n=1 Tax=Massilia sp. 9096 TaxID=1500894 RepID=UPI001EFB2E49|nr:MbcA/ParS/Xre antitoxin family protein [Massilia sp. 9096]
MSTIDPLNPDAMAALQARFQAQSRRAQGYYNVMHEARRIAGGDDAANDWMNAALAEFDGKTPAQLVDAGQEERVLAYLRAR